MKLRVPEYYERFHCIASACPDNCCIGWEIDIDEISAQRYQQVGGAFGEQLRESIQRDGETACFRLKGERCALLNDQNLCEIILYLGEDALCQICRDHPRFTETFGELRETGVGLCCPEAGRLLFSDPEPVQFCLKETPEPAVAEECDPERLQMLLSVRDRLLEVIQDRTRPLTERLCLALEMAQTAQMALEEGDWTGLQTALNGQTAPVVPPSAEAGRQVEQWLAALTDLEPISPAWTAAVERTRKLLAEPEDRLRKVWRKFCQVVDGRIYEYEHLVVYVLFRYFLKAVYTGDCLTPVQLAAVSCLLVGALDLTWFAEQTAFTLADQIELAGLYSKQMEYSEENLAALEERLIFDEQFSCRKIEEILAAVRKCD